MINVNHSIIRPTTPSQNTPATQDRTIPVVNVSNTSEITTPSTASVFDTVSFHHLISKKSTPIEDIVNKLNHDFSVQNDVPGKVLTSMLAKFRNGNHVQHAHFNALLTFLDNGIENKKESAMTLAENLCRDFEKKAPDMKDEHSKKLLSTLVTGRLRSIIKKFPGILKTTDENIAELNGINSRRQVRIHKLEELVEKISPGSQRWDVTPHKFNYKKGLSIENYHFKDETGKVIDVTLIDNQSKKNSINIDNAKDVIAKLYDKSMGVEVMDIKIPDDKGEDQNQVVTLFDRTNLVTLNQFLANQDRQNTPWTLDSAAVAYGSKKEKFIATLDTLQDFQTNLAELHKDKKFGFESYGYLNPETILSDQSGSLTFFDPAPVLIRDILKEEHLHRNGHFEMFRTKDPMFPEEFLSPEVGSFSRIQKAKEDLFSMVMIWGDMLNLNMYEYEIGPFNKTLEENMEKRNKQTCAQLKEGLLKVEVNTLEDVKKLCSGRAGEEQLINHVKTCLANPEKCQASPALILETAATLLAQHKSTFAKLVASWS